MCTLNNALSVGSALYLLTQRDRFSLDPHQVFFHPPDSDTSWKFPQIPSPKNSPHTSPGGTSWRVLTKKKFDLSTLNRIRFSAGLACKDRDTATTCQQQPPVGSAFEEELSEDGPSLVGHTPLGRVSPLGGLSEDEFRQITGAPSPRIKTRDTGSSYDSTVTELTSRTIDSKTKPGQATADVIALLGLAQSNLLKDPEYVEMAMDASKYLFSFGADAKGRFIRLTSEANEEHYKARNDTTHPKGALRWTDEEYDAIETAVTQYYSE